MEKRPFLIVLNGMLMLLGILLMAIAVALANSNHLWFATGLMIVGGGIALYCLRKMEN